MAKDTLSTFAHPAVSPDGLWLYFVSDMPGGMGGYDIWRAELTQNGVGAVENLGEPINTPGDELFPTFRPNGDLYFSSNGHPGMGGLDIFIAKPTQNREESGTDGIRYKLEHPGYPLNSQGDDFGMTFEGLHNRGYFSSNRGDARGWDHIYSFEKSEVLVTVKGWVYEQDGYELPAGQVYMVGNDGTNQKLSVKGDGSFTQEIELGVDYVFLGTCKGYLNHKEELRVDTATVSNEYVLQFPLANISAPVLIDNIFYDFDKATLRPESQTALDELVKLLNENPNVTIELSAHTDYKGSEQYNERLSQRRAESVVNYLIAHGIAADRLTPKGYGESKPKTIKRKVAEKYPFLKEGDVLTEEFRQGPEGRGAAGAVQPAEPPHGVHRAAHHLRHVRRRGRLKLRPVRRTTEEASGSGGMTPGFKRGGRVSDQHDDDDKRHKQRYQITLQGREVVQQHHQAVADNLPSVHQEEDHRCHHQAEDRPQAAEHLRVAFWQLQHDALREPVVGDVRLPCVLEELLYKFIICHIRSVLSSQPIYPCRVSCATSPFLTVCP